MSSHTPCLPREKGEMGALLTRHRVSHDLYLLGGNLKLLQDKET